MAEQVIKRMGKIFNNTLKLQEFFDSPLFNDINPIYREKIPSIEEYGFKKTREVTLQTIKMTYRNQPEKLIEFFQNIEKLFNLRDQIKPRKIILSEIGKFLKHCDENIMPKIKEIDKFQLLTVGWRSFCLAQDIPFLIDIPISSEMKVNRELISNDIEIQEIYDFFNSLSNDCVMFILLTFGIWQSFLNINKTQFVIERHDFVQLLKKVYEMFKEILSINFKRDFSLGEISNIFYDLEKEANPYQIVIEPWRNEFEPSSE